MYFRPVARLLWCAPSERKGCGSTLGQQELAVQRSCDSWHSGRRSEWLPQPTTQQLMHACVQKYLLLALHASCRMQSHADLALIRAMHEVILELIHATRR